MITSKNLRAAGIPALHDIFAKAMKAANMAEAALVCNPFSILQKR